PCRQRSAVLQVARGSVVGATEADHPPARRVLAKRRLAKWQRRECLEQRGLAGGIDEIGTIVEPGRQPWRVEKIGGGKTRVHRRQMDATTSLFNAATRAAPPLQPSRRARPSGRSGRRAAARSPRRGGDRP